MGILKNIQEAFVNNVNEYKSKEVIDASLGIMLAIMEPSDIYEMLMDIYMQNYIEDDELDKHVKEAALFYREYHKS